jgi:glycosyltransferase involved in cell wall biosynthesis
MNVSAMKIARQTKVPYILQPHGSLHPWKLKHKWLIKNIWGNLFERKVIQNADAIHSECPSDRDDIAKYQKHDNIYIVPCGTNGKDLLTITKKITLGEIWPECKNKKIILYLARVDINKGIDLLLKTLSTLKDDLQDYQTLIIGPDYNQTTKEMQQLAKRKGIAQHITWAGMVTEDVKKVALHQSELYVLPSLSENFGISVLEALFCKLPVITTTETAWTPLRDINGGIVVKPTSTDLTKGFRQFLTLTTEEKKDMADRAYQYVKNTFEWESVAQQTIDEYKKVIKRGVFKKSQGH